MELTLVPTTLAGVGYRFTFQGANDESPCKECPVRGLCFRLVPGQTYEVTGLRPVQHDCGHHEGGKVQVCEVEEVSITSTVEARRLRGTAVTWKPIPCGMPECSSWSLCHPAGPPADASYEVKGEAPGPECPAGYDLRRVELRLRHE